MKTLLIRADANLQIGFGHVLRCLALAQAWQDAGGNVVFVCADLPELLQNRLESENCVIERIQTQIGSQDDATQTQILAHNNGVCWVVCDGYNFGAEFLRTLKSNAFSLLVLDDFSKIDLSVANVILNPNAGATPEFYSRLAPATKILVGQQFALLRREFRLQNRTEKVIHDNVDRVLITMGGTDPSNLVPRVLNWLQVQNFNGEVVVLSGARNFNLPDFKFDLKIISAQNDVPYWMNWCDVAIAAAGSTTWELACCGTPAILSAVADNQIPLVCWCDENGVALGTNKTDEYWEEQLKDKWQIIESPTTRHKLSAQAKTSIDGQGAVRITQELWPEALQLRPATIEDARLILDWRNEPQTRSMSLNSDYIDWETHVAWFRTRLNHPNTTLWMAQQNGNAVGMVRFERTADIATISIIIAPESRGIGIGKTLIKSACHAIFGIWDVSEIHAQVKFENKASRRAFETAGFCCETEDTSMPYLNLVLESRT